MKTTPITETHRSLGAKMAEFAGFEMPIVYTTIKDEHQAVRQGVGVFDVSHMGEFMVRGEHALSLLQKVTSNDVSKLNVGQAQYSCLPNLNGGIVDDLLVYKMTEDEYMLVVNAGNITKDWNWIHLNNQVGAELENISDKMGLLAIQGPKAVEILQRHTSTDLSSIPFYHFAVGEFAGIPDTIISATGYTGSGGFELYVPESRLKDLWDALFSDIDKDGIVAVGLGARDTLRLEMGYCLYGNDITDTTSPIEAGLSWITKLKKGDFNSSALFKAQKKEGLTRKLVGFKVDDRRVPRHGYKILNEAGEEIGEVTSGTLAPSLEIPIGMGYVKTDFSKAGTSILIDTGKKQLKATVHRPPFYNQE